jgi:hypothetical protein
MAFFSTVDCSEVAGTATEGYDELNGYMKASVQLRCAFGDRHALVADVVGNRRQWPKGSGGVPPRAVTAQIVPEITAPADAGTDPQILLYFSALVTVSYTTLIADVFTEEIEPTAEFVTLDSKLFRWGSGTGPTLEGEEAPGFLIRGVNFVRKDFFIFSLDPALLSLPGTVNDSTLTPALLDGFTFAAETLLFAPPQISVKMSSTGVASFDVTKKWTYKPEGWNKYFRAKTNAYASIFVAGGSEFKSYPPADHSVLI